MTTSAPGTRSAQICGTEWVDLKQVGPDSEHGDCRTLGELLKLIRDFYQAFAERIFTVTEALTVVNDNYV